MTRAATLLLSLTAIALQIIHCYACQDNNARGSAGCVCFENSEQNQCMDLECPEIHVETCTNPCSMTTQSFSVPKSCCSAPYCSIPAPQTICATQPNFAQGACCTSLPHPLPFPNKCPRMLPLPPPPPPQPPRPAPQFNQGCCCMPYQYPQAMAPAPSYCVQSVVVGGKADSKKDDDKGQTGEGKESGKPDTVGRKGGGNPEEGSPEGGPRGETPVGRPGGGGPGGGLLWDPIRGRLGGGGGGGRLGIDPLRIGGGGGIGGLPFLSPGYLGGAQRGDDVTKRYETYLEKILDVIKDKIEPECVGPSPIMVMQDCSPRVKVRKIRRRKQRRYMVESCEDPDVVVEEEEETPCVFTSTCPCSSGCCCRRHGRCSRHFL